jgi:hypothetical protein
MTIPFALSSPFDPNIFIKVSAWDSDISRSHENRITPANKAIMIDIYLIVSFSED